MTRSTARVRADALLVTRGLADSRAKAQALIMAGKVTSGPVRIDKPGMLVAPDAHLELAASPKFVSRGGDKLDHALEHFSQLGLDVVGTRCLDVGASTGGFTDCLLQRGAAHVVAVDVGHGQLADKLRTDARVTVRERTNARELVREDFADGLDLVVVDASFIGIGKLIGPIAAILDAGKNLVALVKPQFEAGREAVSKGRGVIRDQQVRSEAIETARNAVVLAGFEVVAEVDSAVAGPKGNVERFVWARRTGTSASSGAQNADVSSR
ncbi:MAG TPA: TlyA family RNA methyltransferase [Polyangium sp.]|jgi:23S rRNA (cytidine1920-2'-O)/16S rRNA (cytidine1409-2'-O)-methyltransferase|nr:TlyA family RNA methyltransferase [Polyangium sp.]